MLLFGGKPAVAWLDAPGWSEVVGAPASPSLSAEAPPPVHGCPVIGFVPIAVPGPAWVPGRVPGVVGDTGTSDCCGIVREVEGFCACAIAA